MKELAKVFGESGCGFSACARMVLYCCDRHTVEITPSTHEEASEFLKKHLHLVRSTLAAALQVKIQQTKHPIGR